MRVIFGLRASSGTKIMKYHGKRTGLSRRGTERVSIIAAIICPFLAIRAESVKPDMAKAPSMIKNCALESLSAVLMPSKSG